MKDLLKRPEVVTFLTAAVVAVLAKWGGPAIGVPEDAVNKVIVLFVSIFLGAVFEGKFKGADYSLVGRSILGSTKFRLGLGSILGVTVNALLQPLGYGLPDETVQELLNYIMLAVAGSAGADVVKTITAPAVSK